jgi:hypothetical protein
MTPLQKLGPPSDPSWFFTSYRCRSRASNRAFFAFAFEVALRVTAPPLCVTGPKKVGASTCSSSGPARAKKTSRGRFKLRIVCDADGVA